MNSKNAKHPGRLSAGAKEVEQEQAVVTEIFIAGVSVSSIVSCSALKRKKHLTGWVLRVARGHPRPSIRLMDCHGNNSRS